jgi:acetolactate synthase-1/2/3 large subunit
MDNVKHKNVEALAPEFPEPSEADLDRAAELILSARQPGIHAGFGASDSPALIMELASRLDAPVSTTISGRGVIPEDHDLSVGFGFGNFGTRLAEKTFKKVDLVIAVGCKFSEVGSGGYGLKMPKLLHIDANPATVGRNYKAEVGLAGDAGKILKALIKRIEDKKPKIESSALRDSIREAHEKHAKKMLSLKPWKDAVNPVAILTELRKLMPRDGILTTDSGAHTSWVLSAYDAYKPRTVLSPIDFSSMGYGVPAAIGAMVAAPGRKVVAVVGDGGLLMTGSEFLTAARLGLPLMVVLFNDQALGMIKQTQERVYQRAGAVDICMDWQSYAGAFGFDYVLIKNDSEVQNGLEKAFNSGGPVLVDARIEYRGLNRMILGSGVSYAKRTPPSVIARIAARAIWRSLFE